MENKLDKNKPKPLVLEKPPHKLRWLDVILRPFPKAVVDLTNVEGELVLSNIKLTLTAPADWQNMKYFYSELLPRLLPPEQSPEIEDKQEKALQERVIKSLGIG